MHISCDKWWSLCDEGYKEDVGGTGKSLHSPFLEHTASSSFKMLWSGTWVTQVLELGKKPQLGVLIFWHMSNICWPDTEFYYCCKSQIGPQYTIQSFKPSDTIISPLLPKSPGLSSFWFPLGDLEHLASGGEVAPPGFCHSEISLTPWYEEAHFHIIISCQ